MKKVYIVFVTERNGKYHATADTIKAGENLIPFCKRYHAVIAHLCESRAEADALAHTWNCTYRGNGSYLY